MRYINTMKVTLPTQGVLRKANKS